MTLRLDRDGLTRRIDRCYLIASWAKAPDRRAFYLEMARKYRAMLAQILVPQHNLTLA